MSNPSRPTEADARSQANADAPPTGRLATASAAQTARVLAEVVVPLVAQGAVVRRPRAVALAERVRAEDRAIRLLRRLHRESGAALLRLRVPGRSVAVVLDPAEAKRVLAAAPERFTPANVEKRAALRHFQPDGVLISDPAHRPERRAFTTAVLDTDQPTHHLARDIASTVHAEVTRLLATVDGRTSQLSWPDFSTAFDRLVRRIVLGDAAADDTGLTAALAALRHDANWSYLRPRRDRLRAEFFRRLRAHVDRHEPGSLVGEFDRAPVTERTDPVGQVPHWLFAYDAAGIAAWRALALIGTHPEQRARVRAEVADREPGEVAELPMLHAAVLESLRLWPTTLVVLRDCTVEQEWPGGRLPAGTALILLSSYFHRDERNLPRPDSFDPDLWLADESPPHAALIPFSAGPAACPGRNLVLLTTSLLLADLLADHDFRLTGRDLDPRAPLPATLSHHHLRFTVDR